MSTSTSPASPAKPLARRSSAALHSELLAEKRPVGCIANVVAAYRNHVNSSLADISSDTYGDTHRYTRRKSNLAAGRYEQL